MDPYGIMVMARTMAKMKEYEVSNYMLTTYMETQVSIR